MKEHKKIYEQKERFWRATPEGVYSCKICGESTKTKDLRRHISQSHGEDLQEVDVERLILESKYIGYNIDIDYWVQRYVDRLETKLGLQHQGLYMGSYLKALGVLRSSQTDQAISARLREKAKHGDDYKKVVKARMIDTFLEMKEKDPEYKFDMYLLRDTVKLRNKGATEELIDVYKTLRTVKHIKNKIEEARKKEEETSEE